MEGFIITYNSNKITEINHKLFGKVTSVKDKKGDKKNYYYPGLLDSVPFFRLSNGCIFSEKNPGNLEGMLVIRDATIKADDVKLSTALEYWKGKFAQLEVNNL